MWAPFICMSWGGNTRVTICAHGGQHACVCVGGCSLQAPADQPMPDAGAEGEKKATEDGEPAVPAEVSRHSVQHAAR